LRQVLVNLIGNAVKYTSEGRVVVSADANRTADGLSLVVEVSDTGVGLAPEDQGRVFDPFVQAGHRSSQKGTGLGLAISRSCMEVMGGRLTVQSKLGKGSVFRIELPVDEVDEPALAVHEVESTRILSLLPGQPDYRILIVEDQQENWMVLERMLQSVGFAVRVAQDGERAIEEFRSWRPHFIWMDLGLPGIDGKEAARRIRECEGGRNVKIVAVTASVFVTQRDEVLAAGIDGFLRKPYRPQEIFERMADLLGVRYSYANEARLDGWGGSLDPDRIRAIPQDLREELIAALLRLEPGPIKAVISTISAYDESIAGVLAGFADRYSYSSILAALHAVPDGPAQRDS
jgi:CheY-like chemotaxis protein